MESASYTIAQPDRQQHTTLAGGGAVRFKTQVTQQCARLQDNVNTNVRMVDVYSKKYNFEVTGFLYPLRIIGFYEM